MHRILTAILLSGLAAVALSGCYVVSPYAYPAYVPTYPPPPVPPSPGGAPPRPAGPAPAPPPPSATPSPAPGVSGGPAGSCQTVTVEGHYETRIRPNGQRETVWVPTRTEQICQ
jgi:hypothetical protein